MSKKHHHHEPEETEESLQEENTQEQTPQESEETQPDYYEKYVRLSADFENFRKRTEREKAAFLAYGKKDFVEKLLPAYEVLLRQEKNLEKDAQKADANLVGGIKMILGELKKAFESEGVKKLDVVGKPYDPQTAEAIAVIPAKTEQDGIVLEEVQMGFLMDDKVLRPARVVVGKAQQETKQ